MKIVKVARALVSVITDRQLREQVRLAVNSHLRAAPGICSCCGFEGEFSAVGNPVRTGAMCPKCGSKERHRLFALAVQGGFLNLQGRSLLHIAPEPGLSNLLQLQNPKGITTSSFPSGDSDLNLDIEDIDLPDGSFDVILCSHVLEHVDDRKALKELYRILRSGGELIAMASVIEGWSHSYEDDRIRASRERELHFGQNDHIRMFGADFRQRICMAGFELSEFTAGGKESVVHRLNRGTKVFKGLKR